MGQLPLYTLFDTVRNRFNRHLGLTDYMDLLDALQRGVGMTDVNALCDISTLLWVKNKSQQDELDTLQRNVNVIDENALRDLCSILWIKNKPQQDEFKAFFKDFIAEQKAILRTTEQAQIPTQNVENTEKRLPDAKNKADKTIKDAENDITDTPSVSPTKNEPSPTNNADAVSESGKDMVTVQWNMDKILSDKDKTLDELAAESSRVERWQLTRRYIMTDNYQPFSERQLTQEWRRLRRKQSVGDSREIDIQATVKQVAQQGFFDKPTLKRHFVNDYRLVVLVDWKGSMLAFHTLSDLIVETLKTTLPKTEVWYFRNHPQPYLYGRPDWTKALETDKWLHQFKQNPANVLIISDGGAARGTFVTERLQSWWRFVKQIKPLTPNIVWLNPMPKERWAGTTAGYVEKLVKMRKIGEDGKVIKEIGKLFKK